MAAENVSIIASDFQTQISGAISIGATSFTLQSVTDVDGNDLSDGTYAFTIDRDSASAKEYLVGQLTAATKTVASVSSISAQGVLTANAQKAHRIGANVIISDHSILSSLSKIFRGQGTIDPSSPLAYDTAPTLSSATELATKGYVDSVVTGGTVNSDRIILGSQTAGETVAAGNIVYFKSSDSRWWLADADLTTTFQNVLLGVALGAGTAGNTISGGVQIYGKCDSFTGLTATATYYLSNTAGAVSSSTGTNTVILGQAFSTTGIFFNPTVSESQYAIATSAGAGDAGKLVKTNASGLLDLTFTTTPIVRTYLNAASPATWTKPAGLKYIIAEVQAAGGNGSDVTASDSGKGGGGGGGYSRKLIAAASLGATETITIGAVGANSSFGSIITSNFGVSGPVNQSAGSAGGTSSGGDVNISGGKGDGGTDEGSGGSSNGGRGGSSYYGNGGGSVDGSSAGNAGTGYGGGGSGATTSGTGDFSGGAGAPAIVIVTEYYN